MVLSIKAHGFYLIPYWITLSLFLSHYIFVLSHLHLCHLNKACFLTWNYVLIKRFTKCVFPNQEGCIKFLNVHFNLSLFIGYVGKERYFFKKL